MKVNRIKKKKNKNKHKARSLFNLVKSSVSFVLNTIHIPFTIS